ncbi:MAG: rod shape-determining protein MreD [Actinobacteria bacterium]|nr:rod shape-determining protein MreD [Acidobacteriota bacterium]MBS1195288.1 rod shape-determining protein MreD [Actinomycetota bacterium]
MKWRRTAVAVALVILGVALQTTLFVRLRPFGAVPALALLVTLAVSRHLGRVPSLLVGFSTGLLLDLLSEGALGLYALVLTTVAFATVRLRQRFEDDLSLLIPGVFLISFVGLAMYALLGTIFGAQTLADAQVVRKMLLPAVYNTILSPLVLPPITRLIGERGGGRPGWEP